VVIALTLPVFTGTLFFGPERPVGRVSSSPGSLRDLERGGQVSHWACGFAPSDMSCRMIVGTERGCRGEASWDHWHGYSSGHRVGVAADLRPWLLFLCAFIAGVSPSRVCIFLLDALGLVSGFFTLVAGVMVVVALIGFFIAWCRSIEYAF